MATKKTPVKKGRNKPSAAKLKEFDKKYGDPEKYIKGSDKAPQEQKRARATKAKPAAAKSAMSRAERLGRAAGTAVKKTKTFAQKGLKTLAKGAVPLTLGTAAAQGLATPTESYEKRFGMKGGTLAKDLGIRTLGVASDIGDVLTLGQASRFYRDKQKPKSASGAAPSNVSGRAASNVRGSAPSNVSKTSPARSKTASTAKSKPLSKNEPPVSMRKTGGGDYPVYKKGSSSAQSFRAAFASARKAGKKEFTWQGRKYNTKVK